MQTFFSVVLLASALGIIVSVLLQEGSEGGIGAIGGGSEPSALWGKNKGTSKEVILQRVTIIAAVLFMISTIVLAAK
jgi:preprotein translocase subunit SecG